jgi:hypothetical protein
VVLVLAALAGDLDGDDGERTVGVRVERVEHALLRNVLVHIRRLSDTALDDVGGLSGRLVRPGLRDELLASPDDKARNCEGEARQPGSVRGVKHCGAFRKVSRGFVLTQRLSQPYGLCNQLNDGSQTKFFNLSGFRHLELRTTARGNAPARCSSQARTLHAQGLHGTRSL